MPDLPEDIAALLHPMPLPSADEDDVEPEAIHTHHENVTSKREDTAASLRRMRHETTTDPLLHALNEQRRIRDEADSRIRLLVAYGREFVAPRPYPLETLAATLRASPSGVRGLYDHRDVEQVAEVTGRRCTLPQTPADTAEHEQLLDELAARTKNQSARSQVHEVAAALLQRDWTPYAPVRRTPNPRYAKAYVRWEKRWPNGTLISLFQEPNGWLGVHARMRQDNPRWFSEPYGTTQPDGTLITASDIADALTSYDTRLARHDAERGR
jgi:hypothetical protein